MLEPAGSPSSNHTRNATSSTQRSSRSRVRPVVTTPSWARGRPDEFPDDGDDDVEQLSTPGGAGRRTSSSARPRLQSTSTAASGTGAALGRSSTAEGSSSDSSNSAAEEHHRRNGDDEHEGGWWTFTLPTRVLARVQDYVKGDSASQQGHDEEKGEGELLNGGGEKTLEERHRSYHLGMQQSMGDQLKPPPNVLSLHQAQTPGWNVPWTPFRRDSELHYPSTYDRDHPGQNPTTLKARVEKMLLESPWALVFFRVSNLVVSSCTLALASHILVLETRANALGVIGLSPLIAVIFAPFTLVHVLICIYLEIYGKPMGIWATTTKMMHTLTELVFISLWSASLSLCFDDLFTSSLECTSYTPYARYNTPPENLSNSGVEGSIAERMCDEQSALTAFVFISVVLYTAVLVVSLFRIFHKFARIKN